MTRPANLLILDGPLWPKLRPNPRYRGTCRMSTMHFDNLPEEHEANKLFHWFLEEGGELGVVHNEKKAYRLCELANLYTREQSYEVIEAVEPNSTPIHAGEFLGFDISCGLNNSLLWWGLTPSVSEQECASERVLANIVFSFFSEKLNDNGLFTEIVVANRCRSALLALQAIEPNLLEGGSLEKFQIVGLFRI